MVQSFETVRLDVADGVATLSLNRPDRLNSFTTAMHGEVRAAIDEVVRNPPVRCFVLTASSGRHARGSRRWFSPRRRRLRSSLPPSARTCSRASSRRSDIAGVADMARRAIDAVDWRDGICLESGLPDWISLKVSCQLVTAERLVHFMSEYRRDVRGDDRDNLMTAFREMLINAMEHGAGFDPKKVVNVTAVRTARAIVYHFRDPGTGFTRGQLKRSGLVAASADPLALLDRRAEMGLRPGGFGILVTKQFVEYLNIQGHRQIVIMIESLMQTGI